MSILSWIVVGLVAGTLASFAVGGKRRGCLLRIAVGVIGAFIGGWLFSYFGQTGFTGFNLWSVLVSFVGAVLFLMLIQIFTKH